MADKTTTWTNANGDRDLDQTLNYSNGKPDGVSDWFVNFNGRVSNTAPTVNLDAPKTNNWLLKKWTFHPSYTAGIGTSSDHLEIDIDSTVGSSGTLLNRNVLLQGSGVYHIELSPSASADTVVDMPLGAAGETEVFFYGDIRNLFALGGRITVSGATGFPGILYQDGSVHTTIVRGSETSLPSTCIINGGILNTDRNPGSLLYVNGGTMDLQGIMSNAMNAQVNGGTLVYRPRTDPSASAPKMFVNSGLLDLSQSEFEIDFHTLVIGPSAEIRGDDGVSDIFGSLTVSIDLRKPLP